MAYDTARSIFRTAIRMKAGAFLLEIARSEIAYTDQRPTEYVAVMLAAAMREGFRGRQQFARCFARVIPQLGGERFRGGLDATRV